MPFWSRPAVWLAPGLFEETKRTTGAGKASLIRESSPGRKICFVSVLVPRCLKEALPSLGQPSSWCASSLRLITWKG